jgi:hypothetical protein
MAFAVISATFVAKDIAAREAKSASTAPQKPAKPTGTTTGTKTVQWKPPKNKGGFSVDVPTGTEAAGVVTSLFGPKGTGAGKPGNGTGNGTFPTVAVFTGSGVGIFPVMSFAIVVGMVGIGILIMV